MNEKINRIWRMLNSLILMITFISPWKLVYSDILPSEPFPLTGLRVFLISIPHGLSNIIFLDCFSCVAGGLIAIGYMSLMLYTILNTVRVVSKAADHNLGLRKILFSCAIVSSLFFLQIITPMMLTGLAWGYWFACAVSLSCLWLEFTEWISSKSFVGRLSSKVA